MCGFHGAYLDCMLPEVQITAGLGFFYIQVIYVIVKILTPCFNRPSLLSRSLMEQCTGWPDGIVKLENFSSHLLTHCLSTLIDLPPKLLGVQPSFFPRAKFISVHTNLSYYYYVHIKTCVKFSEIRNPLCIHAVHGSYTKRHIF